ncbi:unnamed protein product [Gongylonema pulchrum]|uniref:G_PROTEIN_RECEP_F1_2 domain-containing protein n=1 Tax=Gongylonema pulchrum TaxID=637853 RepID=A0A183CXY8_9BILA|nr:unnamed protein product [Gongylonema pulchrum]
MFLAIVIVTSIGSVVLYIVVYALTRKNVRSAQKIQMGSKAAEAFARRQRKLTMTMNISCVITVVLFVLPMCISFLVGDAVNTPLYDFVTVYSGISCNFNPLAILAALFIMQEDVKAAVLSSLPRCLHRLIERRLPNFVPAKTFGDTLSMADGLTTQHKNHPTAGFSHLPQQTTKIAVKPLPKNEELPQRCDHAIHFQRCEIRH